MQTKTDTLNGIQWVEIPQQPKTQLYLKRSTPVHVLPAIPLITNPTEKQVEDTLMVLCHVMQNTMSSFELHEIYGNVALVQFEPTTQFDPLLPLPLLPVGYWFNRCYRKFANHVMDYNSLTWGVGWYTQAGRLVKSLCGCMNGSKKFSREEKLYFERQLRLTLTMPTRGK